MKPIDTLDSKIAHQASCKERSRSPPNDREVTESSSASRFTRDKKNNIKNMIDGSIAGTSRKRRDSGYSEGPSDSHKQYLDYLYVLDRLNPIDDYPGTTITSIEHRTD